MFRITFLDNNFQGKCVKFFRGLYKRSKMVLTVAVAIFFVSIFMGLFIGYFSPVFTEHFLTHEVNLLGSHLEKTTLSIFMHNFQSLLLTYIGGIIGIIPVGTLFSNGFIYGSFLGYFTHGGVINHYGVSTPGNFIVYTLPHGIFEIPGFIIAGAAGFRLTSIIISVIKSIIRKTSTNDIYWKFKDSLTLLAIAIILTFIAAIIEIHITPSLGNYITGLNLH